MAIRCSAISARIILIFVLSGCGPGSHEIQEAKFAVEKVCNSQSRSDSLEPMRVAGYLRDRLATQDEGKWLLDYSRMIIEERFEFIEVGSARGADGKPILYTRYSVDNQGSPYCKEYDAEISKRGPLWMLAVRYGMPEDRCIGVQQISRAQLKSEYAMVHTKVNEWRRNGTFSEWSARVEKVGDGQIVREHKYAMYSSGSSASHSMPVVDSLGAESKVFRCDAWGQRLKSFFASTMAPYESDWMASRQMVKEYVVGNFPMVYDLSVWHVVEKPSRERITHPQRNKVFYPSSEKNTFLLFNDGRISIIRGGTTRIIKVNNHPRDEFLAASHKNGEVIAVYKKFNDDQLLSVLRFSEDGAPASEYLVPVELELPKSSGAGIVVSDLKPSPNGIEFLITVGGNRTQDEVARAERIKAVVKGRR